jgi:hypothetical protein
MSKPCREKTITYCFQNSCQKIILKYYGDELCVIGSIGSL